MLLDMPIETSSIENNYVPICGVMDNKFDSEYLDQHFWASCQILTPCKTCGQVIEISTVQLAIITASNHDAEKPSLLNHFERHTSLE
ncbi:hypothetical protein CCR75_004611 [Bremia lactucae]|uniref:Centrosomal protein CEP104 Zn finger domain-containing protein n=1 Tax=Bremia lactucae TaxID=4779 RepID=A0A976ILZ6_BRELC|nr:hypothetical protein CCR75_004611 [Bremia lactucae]